MAKKIFIFFSSFCIFFLVSCGKSEEQLRKDAVLSANIFLSKGDCQSAIDVLEEVERDTYNGKYMQVLASAYACRAGYTEVEFFSNDVSKVGTPAAFGGLTRFDLASSMTAYNSDTFLDLQEAINILLYSGGVSASADPTSVRRSNGLSNEDLQDINAQLLYLLLTQLGLYLHYYGDSSSTGIKASGSGTNVCLANYSNVALTFSATVTDVSTYLGAGLTGSCNGLNKGHPALGNQGALNVKRMCQGVVLLNSLLDVLPAVIGSITNNQLNTVSGISTALTAAKTAVLTAKNTLQMSTLLNQTNQTNCEIDNGSDTQYLEVYFAFMFEVLFQ